MFRYCEHTEILMFYITYTIYTRTILFFRNFEVEEFVEFESF